MNLCQAYFWKKEEYHNTDKPLARLNKKKREESTKLEMKKERLQQTMQKYKGLWDYYEQLDGNKIDNLEEMDRFLEKFNLPRLNQGEIEIMNNAITSTEIEAVIKKNLPKKQKPRTRWLHRRILSSI